MNNNDAWIQTHSGRKFHVFRPSVEEVDFQDIARSLSQTCRFNGHTKRFYSVAEHSVVVAKTTQQLGTGAPRLILQALLHDAAEAYLSDIPTPVKIHLPEMVGIENRILSVIMNKYDLPFPLHQKIHLADIAVLLVEKKEVLNNYMYWGWEDEGNIANNPIISTILRTPPKIDMLTPKKAEIEFLGMFLHYIRLHNQEISQGEHHE